MRGRNEPAALSDLASLLALWEQLPLLPTSPQIDLLGTSLLSVVSPQERARLLDLALTLAGPEASARLGPILKASLQTASS